MIKINLIIFNSTLLQIIIDDLKDNKPQKEIISDIKDLSVKNLIPEHEVIVIVSN